jgi:hypothetical protein
MGGDGLPDFVEIESIGHCARPRRAWINASTSSTPVLIPASVPSGDASENERSSAGPEMATTASLIAPPYGVIFSEAGLRTRPELS